MTLGTPAKICLTLVAVGLLSCYAIRFVVFNRIEKKLPALLEGLSANHVDAHIDKVETSWYRNRITVKGISFKTQEKHELPMGLREGSIASLTLTGVELLPLLISKDITLDSVIFKKVTLTKSGKGKEAGTGNTAAKAEPTHYAFKFNYIKIDSLEIIDLDSLQKPVAQTRMSFETRNLSGELPLKDLSASDLTVRGLRLTLPGSLYEISSDRIYIENMTRATIDSLKVIPLYPKREFVQKRDFETDRIQCVFPSIVIEGINTPKLFQNELLIHQVSMAFEMSVYRDKRRPNENTFKALPDSLLRRLPMAILIDSIKILDSQITYEEFPEKADSAGSITFRNLEAKFYNVSNRNAKALELQARAKFMNDGEIQINGTFFNSEKPHFITGSIRNFTLARINPMLKPATGVSIESGQLELMKFSFWYNNQQSDGQLSLNYHDLKLVGLREKKRKRKDGKKEEVVTAVAKTVLINAFIADDLDKNDPLSKRTGTIHFERDQNKFVFNFWWKSLLSGLKSASGLPGANKPPQAS
jgi:hypothetical protein